MKDSQISQLLTKRRLFSSVLLMNEHLFGPAILFGTLKSGFWSYFIMNAPLGNFLKNPYFKVAVDSLQRRSK